MECKHEETKPVHTDGNLTKGIYLCLKCKKRFGGFSMGGERKTNQPQ